MTDGWSIVREIAFRRVLLDLTDGMLTLIQVMAWCLLVCAEVESRSNILTKQSHRKNNLTESVPDAKVHGANVGPTWGRQDPGWLHVGHMNFDI